MHAVAVRAHNGPYENIAFSSKQCENDLQQITVATASLLDFRIWKMDEETKERQLV